METAAYLVGYSGAVLVLSICAGIFIASLIKGL